MGSLRILLLAIFASATVFQICSVHASLSDSTYFNWGQDKAKSTGPDSVELKLVETGGSGFKSYNTYLFGEITVQIKLVPGNSAGTVTTFYLASEGAGHDEIDFEFLGNSTGLPYTIHTNIFAKGVGQREEQFKVWFDPTDGFHSYTILWTPYSVVWKVDGTPIRVFRNYEENGLNYPNSQPMYTYASLWNADDWATQGGRIKTDWTLAPFVASFQGYNPNACVCPDQSSTTCYDNTAANWWTDASKYYQLSETEYYDMQWIRQNFQIYSYCDDAKAAGVTPPGECSLPQN